MSPEENRAFVLRWYEVWNRGEIDRAGEFLSPDYALHSTARGAEPLRGIPAYQDVMRSFRSAFPDLAFVIEFTIADDERVFVRSRFRGTHRGEFRGQPPTDRPVSWLFHNVYRIAGDRIVEAWGFSDTLTMMQQLGAQVAPAG